MDKSRRPPIRYLTWLGALGLAGLVALLSACSGQAPPAAPKASEAASPAPAKPAAASPAPAQQAAPADWEKEWNALVEAAKKEGKVVFNGPPIPEARSGIPAKFKERFGIEVEYLAGQSSDQASRVEKEREAGLFTVDVFLSGPDTLQNKFYPQRWMDPLRPALILPEVTDPSKWRRGKLLFYDPDELYMLRIIDSVNPFGAVNTNSVRLDDLKTAKDLLDPKFKGKISGWDPTIPGGGNAIANYLYVALGDDYVKHLYVDQEMRLSRDARELSDGLARGTYPINIGMSNAEAAYGKLVEEGFPVEVLATRLSDAPGYLSGASGIMVLMNKAPHPNAAKLMVNWMASREGLEVYARAEEKASLRTDLEESWARPYAIPKPGVTFFDGYTWQNVKDRNEKITPRLKEMLGR